MNKEYIQNENYYINDLIINNNKLYKVNEDFTALDWTSDRNKYTLISTGGGSGSSEASQVEFDNSKTNLDYTAGYYFPKFKTPIPENINLIFSNGNDTYNSIITKDTNNEYRLISQLNNCYIDSNGILELKIMSVENSQNIFEMYSVLAQFFNFAGHLSNTEDYIYDLEDFECSIEDIRDN